MFVVPKPVTVQIPNAIDRDETGLIVEEDVWITADLRLDNRETLFRSLASAGFEMPDFPKKMEDHLFSTHSIACEIILRAKRMMELNEFLHMTVPLSLN